MIRKAISLPFAPTATGQFTLNLACPYSANLISEVGQRLACGKMTSQLPTLVSGHGHSAPRMASKLGEQSRASRTRATARSNDQAKHQCR